MRKYEEPPRTPTYFKNMFRTFTEKEAQLRQHANKVAAQRVELLAEMREFGMSYGKIAIVTGLSRSRVQQLVERGQARG